MRVLRTCAAHCWWPSSSWVAWCFLLSCISITNVHSQERILIPYGSTWRLLKGTQEASSPIEQWRETNFVDTAWPVAPAPFHYGDGLTTGTLLNDMRSNYTCVFLRADLMLTNVAEIQSLQLRSYYDDGFVAWINGMEIARDRVNGTPYFTSTASSTHEATVEEVFTPGLVPQSYLLPGTNVLAVQAFNVNKNTSSDFRFDGELRVTWGAPPPPPSPPYVTGVEPTESSQVSTLSQVTVVFSEVVAGVQAADLLVNGTPAALVSSTSGTNVYTFYFTQPPPGPVQLLFETDHTITDLEGSPFDSSRPGASWSYNLLDTVSPGIRVASPEPGATLAWLNRIQVAFNEEVSGLEAADLLINGMPATELAGSGSGPYTFTFPEPASGSVDITWAAAHGITDRSPARNPFAGSGWSYQVNHESAPGGIVLNELLSENLTGLLDEDGQKQDWIELWNSGSTPVNLLGWSLTDDARDPGRWVFPAVTLNPGQYLVVFASGKNRTSTQAGARLHTSFRLNSAGDYLGLYDPHLPRQAVSELAPAFPEQRGDVSYGRVAAGKFAYLTTPTPGGVNSASSEVAGILDMPTASVQSGFFDQPFTVDLSTRTTDAQIRYTLDGTVPTVGSALYTGPLSVSGNGQKAVVLLRAGVFKAGWLSSPILTRSYIFPEHVLTQPAAPAGFPLVWDSPCTVGYNCTDTSGDYEMDPQVINNTAAGYREMAREGLVRIPTLSITTDPKLLFGPAQGVYVRREPFNQQPVNAEYLLPDGKTGFNIDCGIEIQGQTSPMDAGGNWKSKKLSLRLIFQGDFGAKKLRYQVFPDSPVEEFDTLIISAGHNMYWNYMPNEDQRKRAQYVRDQYISDLQTAAGGLAPHGRFVHLYLNGLYWGLHELHERPDHSFSASYFGGDKSEYDSLKHDANTIVSGSNAAYKTMLALARSGLSDSLAYERLQQYLDVPWLIDYLIVNYWAGNEDWAHKNWYVSRRRTPEGPFRYFAWDSEHVLKGTSYDATTKDQPGGPTELFHLLRANSDFRVLFGDRVHRHFFNGGIFYVDPARPIWDPAFPDRNRPAALYMSRISEIDPAIVCESARWGDVGTNGVDRTDNPLTRNVEWLNELNALLGIRNTSGHTWNYFPNRTANVLNQFRAQEVYPAVAAPAYNQHGGQVPAGFELSMTAAAGTIYYTTNGNDPRLYGSGLVSPQAQSYNGSFPLGTSTVVKARAWLNGNWSALNEARFTVAEPGVPLRFTEIHYHPPGGDLYEFVELQNTGAVPLDLSRFTFQGLTYAFPEGTILPAGALLVLASAANPTAFVAQYPSVVVSGWFEGNLSNGGERLAILDRSGRTVTAVHYDDEGGWPKAADGLGASLEILDPRGDPNSPSNWRASLTAHGTPGLPVSSLPSLGNVVLNEAMAENATTITNGGLTSDWIELYNRGDLEINLSNWSVTDDSEPRKFVFPANTTIPAGGYLVLWCDAATNAAGLHTGFALGRNGDSVLLFDAQTNRVDALTFGLQLADLSLGRVNGEWQLTHPTPGEANAAVTLASPTNLCLNEWLANPVTGGDDWVELFNRSSEAPVALSGIYVGAGEALYQLRALSFVGPDGYVQLFADQKPGANHLELKVPAAGGALKLYTEEAILFDEVVYGAQAEGISQGRLPDGAENLSFFPGSISPGASNYVRPYSGPVLNEVLARNRQATVSPWGSYADYVELFNPTGSEILLDGMRLAQSMDDKWSFPAGSRLSPGGYLRVWCDGRRVPSTSSSGDMNTGFSLQGESGEVVLFNTTGQAVDSLQYGFQIPDLPIGLSGATWRLLSEPTPGAANALPAELGSNVELRINEWMAVGEGSDWFEIFNGSDKPVQLDGLYLTDDPSIPGKTNTMVGTLSFIEKKGFVRFMADGAAGDGRNHTRFSLNQDGETLRIYSPELTLIDSVSFGLQRANVSQGRLPDGAAAIHSFPTSATPGESNFLPIPGLFVNEVLTHTDPPLEDAIELFNATGSELSIGGWFISNSPRELKKFKIPQGTIIPAHGYQVFYEYQFAASDLAPFALNSAHGDSVYISEADGQGTLTGARVQVRFDAAENGVSLGRFQTSAGVDFVPLDTRTFGFDSPLSLAEFRLGGGLTNAPARVGPIVISELLYHPVILSGTNTLESASEEFIELFNLTHTNVPLYDPNAPTNSWRIAGGVEYTFPSGLDLPPYSCALVTAFDPLNDFTALAAFRAKYIVPPEIPIWGPFRGNLRNSGETVLLQKPDSPQKPPHADAGFVPYVLVEQIGYSSAAPWPENAFGTGYSLQRRLPASYGNEPLNWLASKPNAGTVELDSDKDGLPDSWELIHGLDPASDLGDDGPNGDPDADGLSNYAEWLAGTHPNDSGSLLAFEAVAMVPGGISLQFRAVAGRTYTIQYLDSSEGFEWKILESIVGSGEDGPVSVLDSVSDAATRYYRVVTPSLE